ncbi:MAG: type II secretion system protein [Armatimonadetes bacterium]|nr:type II secretion system protein [Armatimonadota bacterium]
MAGRPAPLKSGFTLVELLIACTLLILVLGTVVQILVPAFRVSARTSSRSDLQRSALMSLNRLRADLENSIAPGVVVHAPDAGELLVSIHPVEWIQPDGLLRWQERLILYQWRDGVLRRNVYGPAAATAPLRPSADEIRTLLEASNQTVLLARDVRELSVQDAEPAQSGVQQPFRLFIALDRLVPGRPQPERVELSRKVYLRDG